ncbi:MAG TPA: hypothetical protein VKA50_06560 [Gammaproteobacteria bacterium]|nr:hypothetical protein [Gammaproteobacteria bacterium]
METIDQRRLDHAEQTIRKGLEAIGSDPQNGYYWVWSGHMLKAATLLKYDQPQAETVMRSLVQNTIRHFSSHDSPLALTKQNELILLSILTGDTEDARRIAQLKATEEHNHPFDVVLNRKLRHALGVADANHALSYQASTHEAGFFVDIDKVANREKTDFSNTDMYWKATRKKRYENTIFGQKNIFREVLEKLQRI